MKVARYLWTHATRNCQWVQHASCDIRELCLVLRDFNFYSSQRLLNECDDNPDYETVTYFWRYIWCFGTAYRRILPSCQHYFFQCDAVVPLEVRFVANQKLCSDRSSAATFSQVCNIRFKQLYRCWIFLKSAVIADSVSCNVPAFHRGYNVTVK